MRVTRSCSSRMAPSCLTKRCNCACSITTTTSTTTSCSSTPYSIQVAVVWYDMLLTLPGTRDAAAIRHNMHCYLITMTMQTTMVQAMQRRSQLVDASATNLLRLSVHGRQIKAQVHAAGGAAASAQWRGRRPDIRSLFLVLAAAFTFNKHNGRCGACAHVWLLAASTFEPPP